MPITDILAQISGEPSLTQSTHHPVIPPKRKADDHLRKPVDKIEKTQMPAAGSPRLTGQTNSSTTVDTSMARMKLAQNNQKQPISRPSTSTTSFKNGQPTPPPTNDAPKAPPKKGSFAEIMARGKAAQSTLGQVGKIQHKRIEKQPSKREREDMKAQKASKLQKNLAPGSKFSKIGQNPVRNGQSNGKDVKKARADSVPEKKVKKAALATTGYTGTSRPKPGGASSKPSISSASSRYDRGPDRDRHRGDRYGARYAYPSEEEEEEEEEEDEPDYESDLSDMEAAAFEVDEEEEEAGKIARREDALALAEENRLKREKEEKRKRLAAMAKSRR